MRTDSIFCNFPSICSLVKDDIQTSSPPRCPASPTCHFVCTVLMPGLLPVDVIVLITQFSGHFLFLYFRITWFHLFYA